MFHALPLSRRLLPSLLAVVLSACGPAAGGRCSDEDAAVCDDSDTMLVCEDGRYREIPCRGSGGCTSSSDRVVCDSSGNRGGDACVRRNEGTAICTTAQADTRLTCTNGTWVAEQCVLGCSVVGNSVVCL